MDIEERAERWARDHVPTRLDGATLASNLVIQWTELLRDAYLAGSAQTQRDYVAHYEGNAGHG
jgi:hypothetical protein